MVKLYRAKVSPEADAIEAELQDMIFGYEREIVDPASTANPFGPEHSLPVITNNDRIFSGEQIPGYLKELQTLMKDWQAFQGDSCYVNDKGENC